MVTQTAPSSSNPYMYYVLTKNGIEVRYKRSGQFAYLLPRGSTAYKNALKKRYTNIYRQEYGTDSNSNSSNNTSSNSNNTGTGEDTSTESTSVSEKKWVQKTVEEPITNYEDAVKFGKLEVNKARRNNGHTLECKVLGSNQFKEGEWALVQIPSFDINDYMYITKVDHSLSPNEEWITSLTLLDYPPSFGSGESNKLEEDTTEEDNEDSSLTSNDTSNDTSSNSTSSSSRSSNSTSKSNKSSRRTTRVNSTYKGTSTSSGNFQSGTSGNITGTNNKSTGINWGGVYNWVVSKLKKAIK